jgi:hypothetical protein
MSRLRRLLLHDDRKSVVGQAENIIDYWPGADLICLRALALSGVRKSGLLVIAVVSSGPSSFAGF